MFWILWGRRLTLLLLVAKSYRDLRKKMLLKYRHGLFILYFALPLPYITLVCMLVRSSTVYLSPIVFQASTVTESGIQR